MSDLPELPACLRIPQSERAAAWKGHKFTQQGRRFTKIATTPKEEAATRQLRKELEAAEAAKRAERFERLRELRGRK